MIVDAVQLTAAERKATQDAAEAGLRRSSLRLTAPVRTLIARVGASSSDASDADADVVTGQLERGIGTLDWAEVSTGAGPIKPSQNPVRN